jgi:replicative DNA helicase
MNDYENGSYEFQLISRIITSGNLSEVLEKGITYDDFKTPMGRVIFEHLVAFYTNPESKGSVMGPNILKQQFPNFEIQDDPRITTDALCHLVRQNRVAIDVEQLATELLERLQVDRSKASEYVNSFLSSAKLIAELSNPISDTMFSEALDDIYSEYLLAKTNGAPLAKLSWPWDPLNEETGGIASDDYIVLFGRPKSMKSWVLSYLVGHFYSSGNKVLLYTKEMTPKDIIKRIAASILRLPYGDLRKAKLTKKQERAMEKLKTASRRLGNQDRLICLSGKDATSGDTVAWLEGKIKKYKPDIVCIDGMYLMDAGRKYSQDHLRVQAISRDLRQLVLATGTPIIATTQANRAAEGNSDARLSTIAFSDAIAQDVTAAFRVIYNKPDPYITLAVAGSREWDMDGIRIHGVPATDFSFHSIVTEKEIMALSENDTNGKSKGVKSKQVEMALSMINEYKPR